MSTEMGMDPLVLLQNGESSSDDTENSQDWAKFSTLWNDNAEPKPYADMMDFTSLSSLGMDMDFNPSMSIEPSALHYDTTKFNFSYDDHFNALSSELLATQFPFAFQSGMSDFSGSSSDSSQSFTKERRLSVTSSSSSSGASLSPVPESIHSPAIQPKEEPASDVAAALAQRVRQSAGVMLAVPMNAQLQGMGIHVPEKLPMPRLPRQNVISTPKSSASSSAASTPPPSTPPQSAPNLFTAPAEEPPLPTTTRPKTSHTTIERRYRTNLNARIQSLRMAVPALRVLEDREGGNGKKIKKNVKGSVLIKGSGSVNVESEDGSVIDVIDERGFVDGVKVARKCSKANVLGKAVEYIRVLKKREQRLKAEQAGLKTLISGLVGGPALVREWEKEWRASFGGEEKDEVEGEDEEADDDDSDDEEGEDGDEDGGRKRKRPKSSAAKKPATEKKKASSPILSNDQGSTGMPEKRKRGRPRKVLPPATHLPVASSPSEGSIQDEPMLTSTPFTTIPQWAQQQTQPQQYLLAVFALFSFFNSPLTSSLQTQHHHPGAVLSAVPSSAADAWAWKEYLQVVHLAVSFLVLASFLGSWLGINLSLGVAKMVSRDRSGSVLAANKNRKAKFVSWTDLARDYALEGNTSSLSFYERIRVYQSISSQKPVSVSDLTTLAIVFSGTNGVFARIAAMKARFVWTAAKLQSEKIGIKYPTKISEQLVLETLTVESAASYLAQATHSDRTDGERAYTPIEVLGSLVVKERIKQHIASLFVHAVEDEAETPVFSQTNDEEWRRTLEAASELGGHVAELGKTLELAWKADVAVIEDAELLLEADEDGDSMNGLDGDIRALLTAVVLYRRLFAAARDGELSSSTLLSPPPTPTAKTTIRRGQMLQALRTVLGSSVFEEEGIVGALGAEEEAVKDAGDKVLGLEDARDQVVDLIFDSERRLRAALPS